MMSRSVATGNDITDESRKETQKMPAAPNALVKARNQLRSLSRNFKREPELHEERTF
jgi:hypothetical protein